ncbi:MAG: TPR end-of-group domain-containing protein [Flavobacteriales bacterium]
MIYYKMGKLNESEKYIQQLINNYESEMAFQIAGIYAVRNKVDKAFFWLEKAYRYHDIGLNEMLIDPDLENLHEDPR